MLRGKESTLKGLADLAYKKPVHSRDNYVLVADNGHGTRIYRDYHNNDIAVIERGTQSLTDIGTNIHAAISGMKSTNRFKKSKQFVEDFAKKNNFNASDFTFSGHSMGSANANALADHFKSQKVTAFNPPLYHDVPQIGKLFIGEKDFITKPSAFLFNRKVKDPIIIPGAGHTLSDIPDSFQ
jgi:hypothetical protein